MTFFERPAAIGQLGDGPPDGGGGDPLPEVLLESLAVLFSRVRSSFASRCLGSHPLSRVPFLEGLPGIALGCTSPVSLLLFSQRFMVGIDTEKVFATCSLGVPESTAESTLNLRSFEYGFMPRG